MQEANESKETQAGDQGSGAGGQKPEENKVAENAASNEKPKSATPEAEAPAPPRKIIFSSDEKRYGKPPASVRIGMKTITLPPPEAQLAGFEHKDAAEIVRSVRGYKWLEAKG